MIVIVMLLKLLLIQVGAIQSELKFVEAEGKLSLYQGTDLIFGYQVDTKSHQGAYPRANYVHPLNDFSGHSLTEDFPADHLHQRGIFWTWHQLYWNDQWLADPWICKGIEWKVHGLQHEVNTSDAWMASEVNWLIGDDKKNLISEKVQIGYKGYQDYYSLDFRIILKSLEDGVEIGGSDDNKGYGGFSARLALGDNVTFSDHSGLVSVDNEQVQAGNWVVVRDIGGGESSVVIMYHPESSATLQGWILREKGSMQNPVWPGRDRYKFKKNEQIELKARLVIFRDKATTEAINEIYKQYLQ